MALTGQREPGRAKHRVENWPAREGREREKESQMAVRGLRNRAGERRKLAWNKLWANDTAETS